MSEIRGVKYSAIKDGYLTINNVIVTVDGKPVEKTSTKTIGSTRVLKLPQVLENLINHKKETSDSEYVTTLSGQAIYKRFSRLLEKNNLPHIRFHDLRHLNASVMLKLGIQDKYAMERGGWSTTSTLKSVYQHTFSSEREKADALVDEYFSNIYNK
jgi:integrase